MATLSRVQVEQIAREKLESLVNRYSNSIFKPVEASEGRIYIQYDKDELFKAVKKEMFSLVESVLAENDEEDEAEEVFEVVWEAFTNQVFKTLTELSKKAVKEDGLLRSGVGDVKVEYFGEVEFEDGRREEDKFLISVQDDILRQVAEKTVEMLLQEEGFESPEEVEKRLTELYAKNVNAIVEDLENIKRAGNKLMEKLLEKTKTVGRFLASSAVSAVKTELFYDAGVLALNVTEMFLGPVEERLKNMMEIHFEITGLEDLYEPTEEEKGYPLVRKFIKSSGSYEPELVKYGSGSSYMKGFVGREEVLCALDGFKKDEYWLELHLTKEKTSEDRYALKKFEFIERKAPNSQPRITYFSYLKERGVIEEHEEEEEYYQESDSDEETLSPTLIQSISFSGKRLSFYFYSDGFKVKQYPWEGTDLSIKLKEYEVSFVWKEGKLPFLYLDRGYMKRNIPLPKELAFQWLELIGGSFQGLLESVEKAKSLGELSSVIKKIKQSRIEDVMVEYGVNACRSTLLVLLGSVYKQLNDLKDLSRWKPVKNHRYFADEYQYEIDIVNGQVLLKASSPSGKFSGVWTISSSGVSYKGNLIESEREVVERFLSRNQKMLAELLEYLSSMKGAKAEQEPLPIESFTLR